MHSPALDNKPEYTPPSTPTGVPSKLTTTARIALAVLLTGELMNIVDDSVVVTAIPALQQSLGAGPAAVQWVTAGYALTFALALITGGRLGDIHGRRKMFLLGAFGFTLASLLCGLAAGPGMLIAARALQGAAAAVMIPQVLATLHATFTGAGRSRAFALYGAVLSLGSVAGPVLGGFLTEANLLGLSWRPIFLINVPVGIVVVLLGRKFVAEAATTEADRLDLIGVGLSATAMVLILFPLTEGRTHGWPLSCWLMLAAGLLVLGVFVRHLRHSTDRAPLVDLSLFQDKHFRGGLSAQLMLGLLCGLYFLTWALYLQRGLGMSPAMSGSAFALLALGELAGATLAAKTAGRFARRLPQTGVMIALAAITVYGLQICGRHGDLTLSAMIAPVVLLGFGLGMVGGPIADLAMAQVPHQSAGSASGLFNTAFQLGAAFGGALTGPVYFAVTGGSSDRVLNHDGFIGVLWTAGGVLTVMWALMFYLPRQCLRQVHQVAGGGEKALSELHDRDADGRENDGDGQDDSDQPDQSRHDSQHCAEHGSEDAQYRSQ